MGGALSGFAVGAIDAVGDEEAIRDAIKSLGARVVLACDERAARAARSGAPHVILRRGEADGHDVVA